MGSSEATQQQSISQTLDSGHPAACRSPRQRFCKCAQDTSELLFSPVPVNALNFVRSDKGPKLVCYHTTTTTAAHPELNLPKFNSCSPAPPVNTSEMSLALSLLAGTGVAVSLVVVAALLLARASADLPRFEKR